jgi:N-acetylglucosamine-6-sulfatase
VPSYVQARLVRVLQVPIFLLLVTCDSDQPLSPDPSHSVHTLDATPPTVAITAPLAGAVLTSPSVVSADASDDVLVAGVEFFLNAVSLGPEDDTAPYEAILNTDTLPAAGADLTALARDAAGNTSLSPVVSVVVFHPDTTPPAVAITGPLDGSIISAPTTVTAEASDDFLLAGVTFQANGVDLAVEDLEAPYEVLLDSDSLPDGPYDLVAVARDTAGNIATSALVNVTIFHPDVTFPTVVITAPLEGFSVSGLIGIVADATDDELVAGVEFFLNAVSLGPEDTTAPYGVDLDTGPLADGPIELTAVAHDNSGNATLSGVVTVTVFHPDVTPPSVVITAPLDGATLTAPTTVTAEASDDFLLAGVTFQAKGVDLAVEDLEAPYEALLDSDTLPDGSYDLVAVARDTAGNTATSATVTVAIFHPDLTPPTVAITAPLDGTTLTTPTAVTADASDDKMMAGVQFKLTGLDLGPEDVEAPYEVLLNTDTLPDGMVDLTAVARDTSNNTALSAVVRVTVFHPDVTPPTVAITSPLAGATIAGIITVTANASDDRQVAGVQFLLNGANLDSEDLTAPYAVTLDSRTLPDGPANLAAIARDTAGNTATSATVGVVVSNPVAPQLNIVLILTDDQRPITLAQMPLTMSRLGNPGVQFVNGFSNTPLCCPARATVLTGLYAHNHQVLSNASPWGAPAFADHSTIATWLAEAGYRTGLVGKYMNLYDRKTPWPYQPPGWSHWAAFKAAKYFSYTLVENGRLKNYGTSQAHYSTAVLASKAVTFINSTPASQPLFLEFAPLAPHAPATPASMDKTLFGTLPKWRPPSFNEADVSDKPAWVRALPRLSSTAITNQDQFRLNQLRSLQAVDRAVDNIVNALIQTGRMSTTAIVFASDNGLSWGEHRWLAKNCLYDECIRIPFMVLAPGIVPRTDQSFVTLADLAPTFAEWAGVQIPGPINGVSLVGLLTNPSTPWRQEILIEALAYAEGLAREGLFSGVRTQRYAYAEHLTGEKELYDMSVDSYQLTNIASDPANAALMAELSAVLAGLKSR